MAAIISKTNKKLLFSLLLIFIIGWMPFLKSPLYMQFSTLSMMETSFNYDDNLNINHDIDINPTDYKTNSLSNLKIDVVYLWVNGSDPEYVQLRQSFEREYYKIPDRTWSPSIDHGELKLSLRSLYQYGELQGWLGNIYIVTTNKQYPNWLNLSHPKIHIIDDESLLNVDHPSFNSHSFYLMLYKIHNISRYFIQFDDDFILIRNKTLNDLFFIENDTRIISTKNWVIRKNRCNHRDKSKYALPIQCGLVDKMFNFSSKETSHWALHTIRVWDSFVINEMWNDFKFELNTTINHPFRHRNDIDLTSFYPIYDRWKYPTKYNIKYLYTQKECVHFDPLSSSMTNTQCHHPLQLGSVVLQDDEQYDTEYYMKEQEPMLHYILATRYKLNFQSPYELINDKLNNDQYKNIKIMGHRGSGYNLFKESIIPELTLPHLDRLKQFNIKWVEIDIALTKDDVLIVHHTENVLFLGCISNFTMDKHIDVGQLTYNEILENYYHIYYEQHLKIPTLKEYLLIAKEYGIGVQIELKYGTKYGMAAKCIRDPEMIQCIELSKDKTNEMIPNLINILIDIQFEVNKLIVSSFEGYKLKNFNDQYYSKTNKKAHTALITGQNGHKIGIKKIDKLIKACKIWDIDNISIFVGDASFEICSKFKKEGLKIQIGMPGGGVCMQEQKRPFIGDESKDLEKALSYLPDVITTNQPVLASAIRDGFGLL